MVFLAISCGVSAFPVDQAVTIAVGVVRHFSYPPGTIERVYFFCFEDDVVTAYKKALTQPLSACGLPR